MTSTEIKPISSTPTAKNGNNKKLLSHSSSSSIPPYIPIRFDKENAVRTKSIVGRGQFAISFMHGRIELDYDHDFYLQCSASTAVLFKSVNCNDNRRSFKALVRELNVLETLKPHPSILNLVGSCTNELKNREIYLAFEFCGQGNLLKFLRHCNPLAEFDFDTCRTIVTTSERGPVLTLTRHRLLQWTHEIILGMEYLASKKICHNDLAARNILVTNTWETKICNFAFSQKIPTRNPPHALSLDVLPVKWMAPETIQHLIYSHESDVWSLGVTIWEVYTVGEIPYRHFPIGANFWKLLCNGLRLEKPRYASNEVWKIITPCWNYDRDKRVTFPELQNAFHSLLNNQTPSVAAFSKDQRKNRVCDLRDLNLKKIKFA